MSFNITILPDEVLENAERFDVLLTLTNDMGKSKVLDRMSITIIDTSPGISSIYRNITMKFHMGLL